MVQQAKLGRSFEMHIDAATRQRSQRYVIDSSQARNAFECLSCRTVQKTFDPAPVNEFGYPEQGINTLIRK